MRASRESGVLLHPTSLPGPEAIGTIGADARAFVHGLAEAKQSVWQILPLGPPGYGDSPYMASSAFAGNPWLIDVADLVAAGWLDTAGAVLATQRSSRVDMNHVRATKGPTLTRAAAYFAANASNAARSELQEFIAANRSWLDDFALFCAISDAHGGAAWQTWPAPLRDRDPETLASARTQYAGTIERIYFEQFVFARQWAALRREANACGVELVGDVPIFVAGHSADVWTHRHLFDLTVDGWPRVVAGVPPDYFSETGQRWGNPLYRWETMAGEAYAWWIERFRATFKQVDRVRVDHFRAFEAYWEIPAEHETAIGGTWRPGPGADFFDVLIGALATSHEPSALAGQGLPIIAEDLGTITPEVTELRQRYGMPGMRVLHFGFGSDPNNPHRLENHTEDTVAYTGTHDNNTTLGWYRALDLDAQHDVRTTLGTDDLGVTQALMNAAASSKSRLAVFPMQDVLKLDEDARMNTPGIAEGNWMWRMLPHAFDRDTRAELAALTMKHGRAHDSVAPPTAPTPPSPRSEQG